MNDRPSDDRLLKGGVAAHRAGRIVEAEAAYRTVLERQSLHFEARHMLGVLCRAKGRPEQAVTQISLALTIQPESAEAYNNLANAYTDLGKMNTARACLKRALRIQPRYFQASLTAAQLAWQAADAPEAFELFSKAAALAPTPAWQFSCKGQSERARGNLAAAAIDLAHAAAADPALPGIHAIWGEVLEACSRFPEALVTYRKGAGQRSAILSCLEGAGRILRQTFRREEAVMALKAALCFNPAARGALLHLASTLFDLRRLDAAQRWFSAARVLHPTDEAALLGCFNTALYACDWTGWERLREEALSQMRTGSSGFAPFSMLATGDDPAEHLLAARAYAAQLYRDPPSPLWQNGILYKHERPRIGYLSADFHTHATAYLIAELIEAHDRRKFEIIGFSYGPDDGSPMRHRLIAAFDRFHDVPLKSAREIAELIRQEEIDILIDLKGYTQLARAGILAFRPAPAQVNYLGYPGTLGSPFHDYLIADPVVIPPDEEQWYSETIVRLPGSYQVNDSKREIASERPTRQSEGLPEDAFVFCCFNNNWKIGRAIFDRWMGLLRDIPNSVLWLIQDNDAAACNLRKEAERLGVDPSRLIFSSRIALPEHLARHCLADLFLDTLPYGAHTTASDAIFAGLPLLTCTGRSFASRVSASLLTTVGVRELIATSLDEYAAKARLLATDPDHLKEIRAKLMTAPGRQILFQAASFVQGYEEALRAIGEATGGAHHASRDEP